MKKIINGKRYDTDTATTLGEFWNGVSRRDFSYINETLYQKRTGEFFLFGEGGAMTRYAETVGQNEWTGGCKLIPLTAESAREWAEKHLTADEYESIFGEAEEDESKKVVTYSLPVSAIEKVRGIALGRGASMSDIVAEAIENL